MARLLGHLEHCRCVWAPRYLGEDELGRDVFSYLPGSTPVKWEHFSDAQVREAARMLRHLHEVTRASYLSSDCVVCHNDPGPNNFVFRDDVPVGLIDFDMASPGDPLEDLGYMAWAWCISSKPSRGTVVSQARQVRTLADAYGATSVAREELPDRILERQARNIRFWTERRVEPGETTTASAAILEVIEWSERERRYTEKHLQDFVAALLC